MSQDEARQQGIHLRCLWNCNFFRGEPVYLHQYCGWEEAKAGVPRDSKDLPVFWGGLRKVRGYELSAPGHTDVWL